MESINRYRKAGIKLDDQLRIYNLEYEEQSAFEEMQKTGFLVADKLLSQPDGAYAVINGVSHWVSPIGNQLSLIMSADIEIDDGAVFFDDAMIMTVWELDPSSVKDILNYQKDMENWLASPTYHFANQDELDEAALQNQSAEMIEYTREFIQSVKQSCALDQSITATKNEQQGIGF